MATNRSSRRKAAVQAQPASQAQPAESWTEEDQQLVEKLVITREMANHAPAEFMLDADHVDQKMDVSSVSNDVVGNDQDDATDLNDSWQDAARKKLGRRPNYQFNRKQEEDLVDWYRTHPELYDRNHKHYQNKGWKTSLISAKAKEFPNCNYTQLYSWLKGQRTRYGKYSQIGYKAGCSRKGLTPRQQWIIEKWRFIKPHIVRTDSRPTINKEFDPPSPAPSGSAPSGSTPSGSGSTSQLQAKTRRMTAVSSASSTGTLRSTGTPLPNGTPGSTNHGSSHTRTPVEDRGGSSQQGLIGALTQEATEATEAGQATRTPVQPQQTSHEKTIDTFLAFLKTLLLKIPEDAWFNYTMAALTMAHDSAQPQLQISNVTGHNVEVMGPPHQQACMAQIDVTEQTEGPSLSEDSASM